MIKSLKSYDLVPKLMGHSAQVCEEYYTCVITEKIPVDFKDIEVKFEDFG